MNTMINDTLTHTDQVLIPTIIGVADSTHYLVGAVDESNNFISLNQSNDIVVMGSLVEAKRFLRGHNIASAELEFQTAYDEMCGTSITGRYSQRIEL